MTGATETPSKYDERGRHPYVAYLKARYPGYDTWRDLADVPVVTGDSISDLAAVDTSDWAQFGVPGALLNLGDHTTTDAWLLEIPAGERTTAGSFVAELIVLVVDGTGTSEVETSDGIVSVPWRAGTVFGVPLNARHWHRAGAAGARVLIFTDAPLTMDLFHSVDFVENSSVRFPERTITPANDAGLELVRRPSGRVGADVTGPVAADAIELHDDPIQGTARSITLSLAGSLMTATVSELPTGCYTQAHTYGPGTLIYVLAGAGRTTIERQGKHGLDVSQVEWRAGALVAPRSGSYVQHSNLGPDSVRYLTIERPRVLFPDATRVVAYPNQDPAIRSTFERELAARGLSAHMPLEPGPGSDREVPCGVEELGGYRYSSLQAEDGIPVHRGFYLADVAAVERTPWSRMGGKGAYINLADQDIDDAYVLELDPGEVSVPQRHLFEEAVLVLSGRGSTSVWYDDDARASFEWTTGSLFALPMNANYQHFNGDGHEPAVLLSVTSAPVMLNLFGSREFVFDHPYQFRERFSGESDAFRRPGTFRDDVPGSLWETNFLADIRNVRMAEWNLPGRHMKHTYIALAANVMKVHISEFASGTYKAAHRHGAGAHVLILDGEGYSLMWPVGGTPTRYDWQPRTIISPPANWYHQHFNTGSTPATYMAFHRPATIRNDHERGQISFEDEEPMIRADWEAELVGKNVQNRMPPRG